MARTERSVTACFDFARDLLRARDAEDVVKLQVDFMSSPMRALSEQVREMARQTAAPAGGSGRLPR